MINIKKLSSKLFYRIKSKGIKKTFAQKEAYFKTIAELRLTGMTVGICRAEFLSYIKSVYELLESLKEEKTNDYYVNVINRAWIILVIRHLRTLKDNKVFSKLNVEYNVNL